MLYDTDRLVVTEIYGRYSHAFDEARARECSELFTAEATFATQGRSTIKGRGALEEFFAQAAARSPGVRHFVSNIVLEGIAPDRVDGSAYAMVLHITDDSVRLASLGVYRDEFVRTDVGWQIQSRLFSPVIPESVAGAALVSA